MAFSLLAKRISQASANSLPTPGPFPALQKFARSASVFGFSPLISLSSSAVI